MENDAVLAVFSASMVFFLVLADQPRVVVDKIEGVSDIVVNVTDDVSQKHEEFQNAEFDVVANALETIRHCCDNSVAKGFFSLHTLLDDDGEVVLVYFNCCELDADWLPV